MSSSAPEGEKYAALLIPRLGGPEQPLPIAEGLETFIGRMADYVDIQRIDHWRGWLGSIEWERISGPCRVVLARCPSDRPEVSDEENLDLRRKVDAYWRALLLCDLHPASDSLARFITGAAGGAGTKERLRSIVSSGSYSALAPLWYARSDEYIEKVAVPLMKSEWEASGKVREAWFARWLDAGRHLSSGKIPRLLFYALLAHAEAKTADRPEFSLPGLVRTAEGVLGLPRATGRKEFVARSLRLVPALNRDAYVGANAEELLSELHDSRSECVHGKVPFLAMQTKGPDGVERVAKMSYVADVLAREALLAGLRCQDQAIFDDRDALEDAWRDGRFPGSTIEKV